MHEECYKFCLNTFNFVVCVFNVVIQAIVWVFDIQGKYKASSIVYTVE